MHTRERVNINKLGSRLRKLGYERMKRDGIYGYKISKLPVVTTLQLPSNEFNY